MPPRRPFNLKAKSKIEREGSEPDVHESRTTALSQFAGFPIGVDTASNNGVNAA